MNQTPTTENATQTIIDSYQTTAKREVQLRFFHAEPAEENELDKVQARRFALADALKALGLTEWWIITHARTAGLTCLTYNYHGYWPVKRPQVFSA